jgi:hypothetical protein
MDRDRKTNEETPHLDVDADRGELAKEGFGDYDKEAHPTEVDIEGGDEPKDPADKATDASMDTDARDRVEIHFHTMTIRNRGQSGDSQSASL